MLMVLIVSCVVFVFGHLLLSHIPVREALIKRLTFGGFMGFYSLMALGSMLGMIIGYRYTPTTYVWSPVMWTRWLPLVGMPLVTYLFLAGFTAKNPTSAGQEGALAQEDLVTGVLKVTRHPGLWGFALWGLIHIPANGELGALLLFGSVSLLAVLGMLHIDQRRHHKHGEAWEAFAQQTSLLPFGAALTGKVRLTFADIGWKWPLLSLALYMALLLSHQWLIGYSPYPW